MTNNLKQYTPPSEVKTKNLKLFHDQKGQILVIVFVALGVVLFSVLSIIAGSQIYFSNTFHSVDAEKAFALAEAGIDKTLATLNRTGGNFSENDLEVSMGEGYGSYSVKVTSTDVATKMIESTGYVPNKDNAKVKKTIKIKTSRGVGVAFNYGIQVGEGGMELGNGNLIKGSIYSNGSITAGNSNIITGDAFIAGGAQATADQQTECEGSNCTDYIFGKIVFGESRLDVAQSFKPTINEVLNRISVKIKKAGNPTNAVKVRILSDSSGKPNKNGVLATGDLVNDLVTDEYGWIDVAFSSLPALTANTTYWLMISTTLESNANKYWVWQNVTFPSYICENPDQCVPKWSADWKTGNPTWTLVAGDLSFKTYMGGAPTVLIGGSNKMNVNGSAYANTIENLIIGGDAYYQTIANSSVAGISHSGQADQPPKVFPISDANVTDWKKQAGDCDSSLNNCQNVLTGDITNCVNTLGSNNPSKPGIKIEGSINFNSGCRVTVKSPIWITGDLTLNSNNIFTLDSSYNETSGVIIVGGKVTINTTNHFNGTGIGSSLLMVLTEYDSRTDGVDAIAVNSNGNTGVYYASTGIINPGTGNSFKELTAWKIRLINSSEIDYETGLSSTLFTSGPGGAYSLVKGTYQVK